MNMVSISTRDGRTEFSPGDRVELEAEWQLVELPRAVDIRLVWYTRGKGSQDVEVVERLAFADPKQAEARPFAIQAPLEPYSFSGKLISLIWALELVLQPGKESTRLELTIAPNKEEIVLKP